MSWRSLTPRPGRGVEETGPVGRRQPGRPNNKKSLPLVAALLAVVGVLALVSAGGASADGTLSWTGQGTSDGQLNTTQCDEGNTPYLLWIFTLGGGDSTVTSATLTVNGDAYSGQQIGQEFHFATAFYALDPALTDASVAYAGDLGSGNANLVISHGCPGEISPPAATTQVATHIDLEQDGHNSHVGDDNHVDPGSTVHDDAVVTSDGQSPPDGAVEYFFFHNIDCTPEGTSVGGGEIGQDGVAPPSNSQEDLAPGSYSFHAVFHSSDTSQWTDSTSPCEPLTVGQASSTVTHIHAGNAVDPASLLVGTTVHDDAIVSPVGEGVTPTGTVTFVLYAGTTCSGEPVSSEEADLEDGAAESSNVTLPDGGLSYLVTYNGDGTYSPSTATCESVLSTAPVTTVTTTSTPPPAPPAPPVKPKSIDLAITKSVSPGSVAFGGQITWTLLVRNNGPDVATGVKVADPLPAGAHFVSVSASQGTCTGGAVVSCDLGSLAVGTVVTIQIHTTAAVTGDLANTATVVGNEAESNTANNASTAAGNVRGVFKPPAQFCTAVVVSPKSIFVGRTATLTLRVMQHGKPAAGIRIRLKGSTLGRVTKPTNKQGVVRTKVNPKKAGIVSFAPVAHKKCKSPRVGVVGIFTPPVTG